MAQDPRFSSEPSGDAIRLSLAGSWTIEAAPGIEAHASGIAGAIGVSRRAIFDFGGIERLDTAGAWLIDRTRRDLAAKGVDIKLERLRPEFGILLREAHYRDFAVAPGRRSFTGVEFLADIGESVATCGQDILNGVAFLGELVEAIGRSILAPRHFRFTSLVFHIEAFALRSVPIIALINFLVGCIVAQQGIFQLQRFGAATFAVDLIGILILRELGVLLTSIMIAGRSGSAITAELGSMKMREEVDALKVMGLRPVDVLIVPRLLALVISLPLLTFIADMAAIFGGLLVAWAYGGISPETYMVRLQGAIGFHTFTVGLIKAPFMALVIGTIATLEGFAVAGSAESLGRQVTGAVVKAIFMVIVVDGLFAMFFAGLHY